MHEQSAVIRNRLGLHARPAAALVKVASKFTADITLGKDGTWVNAKSILGVMTLAAECGSTVTVRANGDDGAEAVAAMVECLAREFVEQ
jgi:phosphocarrier protein